MIKGVRHQKDIIINLYAPNFIKSTINDLKVQTDSNTVVVGDFNTPLSLIHMSSKQKNQQSNPRTKWCNRSNGPNWCLQNTPSKTAQCIFFTATHGTFFKIDHNLGHKASLTKYKKIEVTPCILYDHNALKLEHNNKNNNRKNANNWRLE
jgi:hypothetical protein